VLYFTLTGAEQHAQAGSATVESRLVEQSHPQSGARQIGSGRRLRQSLRRLQVVFQRNRRRGIGGRALVQSVPDLPPFVGSPPVRGLVFQQ